MVEKIEVAYKPVIGPEGFIAYHKYILYTNSAGEQFYARGGWEFNPLGEPDFRLVTEEGAYVDGTKDFDPSINNPNLIKHPAETVTAGDDLSTKWQGIKDAIADIGSRNIPYDFKDANSNATVDEALRTAGVPQALRDGPSDLWAPGSDYNLPGGDVGPNNGNFGEESSEFLRKKFRDLNEKFNDLKEKIKDFFDDAKDFVLRRDPLTLDLDGDGLETTGIAATNPIQFDHDGDGIKNGTGWVLSDDAFLVLDKNGNGTIDSGRELFGDSTIKSNGQTAVDGFDALADLDSLSNGGNADGKISNLDSQFANLRLWRDLNQDGISQTGELFTLTQLNISSINVTKTANSQTLPNGNQIADLGTFTRTDGATGNVGAVTGNMADINLASDTFHRTFPNVLDTSSVATLPDMQGSGAVRDLREAATQSSTLQSLLTQYSAATTRAGQIALIDQLLDAWADTGGMAESMTQRVAAMQGYTRTDGVVIPYTLTNNLTAEWQQKLHIIETFNGSYFFGLPSTTQTAGAVTGLSIATPTATSTSVQITANFNQQQLDLLQQSYDAIKGSVYDALLLQTRFKPLLDQINLVIDANGIRLDFSQVSATFETKIGQNAANDYQSRLVA